MTARQFVDSPAMKLAAYALALGIAWATLRAEVAQKADKTEMQLIAAEVMDLHAMFCRDPKYSGDSSCLTRKKP